MKLSTFDIFNVPMYDSLEARLKDWSNTVGKLVQMDIPLLRLDLFADLNHLMRCGFLAGTSASYLLTGRAPAHTYCLLESFIAFMKEYESVFGYVSRFNLPALWKRKNLVVDTESTFLFPLAELASDSIDFEDELSSYYDFKPSDLQSI